MEKDCLHYIYYVLTCDHRLPNDPHFMFPLFFLNLPIWSISNWCGNYMILHDFGLQEEGIDELFHGLRIWGLKRGQGLLLQTPHLTIKDSLKNISRFFLIASFNHEVLNNMTSFLLEINSPHDLSGISIQPHMIPNHPFTHWKALS